jgi:Acyl-CoA dehydrogenase, C-terminal domain
MARTPCGPSGRHGLPQENGAPRSVSPKSVRVRIWRGRIRTPIRTRTALDRPPRGSPDADERTEAEGRLALLTPVIKAFGSDKGFETTVNCQQIWGGHGYIAENGMDQFVRDARIAMIYEGANGVQAMDLVGRKLGLRGGETFVRFIADVASLIVRASCQKACPEPVEGWEPVFGLKRDDMMLNRHCERSEAIHHLNWIASLRSQ